MHKASATASRSSRSCCRRSRSNSPAALRIADPIRSILVGLAERRRYPLKQAHARSLLRHSSRRFYKKARLRPIGAIRRGDACAARAGCEQSLYKRDGVIAGVGFEPAAQRVIGTVGDLVEISRERARVEAADHRLDRPDRGRRHRQPAEAERDQHHRLDRVARHLAADAERHCRRLRTRATRWRNSASIGGDSRS